MAKEKTHQFGIDIKPSYSFSIFMQFQVVVGYVVVGLQFKYYQHIQRTVPMGAIFDHPAYL